MNHRVGRINGLLRAGISRVLSEDVNDPRLSTLVSITEVDTAPDLSQALVYVSVLGSPDEKSNTMAALKSAASFVRRCLRKRVTLRLIPELSFRLDESIERGASLLRLIDDSVSDSTIRNDSEL